MIPRLKKPYILHDLDDSVFANTLEKTISNPLNRDCALTAVTLRLDNTSPFTNYTIHLVSPDTKRVILLKDGYMISRWNAAMGWWLGRQFWPREWNLYVSAKPVESGLKLYITYQVEEW